MNISVSAAAMGGITIGAGDNDPTSEKCGGQENLKYDSRKRAFYHF